MAETALSSLANAGGWTSGNGSWYSGPVARLPRIAGSPASGLSRVLFSFVASIR